MISIFIKNFEEIISGIFLSVTVLVVILNVILRYIFNYTLVFSSEIATSCFVWSVFVGSAGAYKHKMHIGIDIIVKLFPKKVEQTITLVTSFLMSAISGYIVYLSVIFIQESYTKLTPVLGLSSAYVSSSVFFGFLLIFCYSLKDFYMRIKSFL